jgi:hypothetical protein
VTLEPVDGGPNYLQQFTNHPPAGQFPIGIWLQCVGDQGQIGADIAVGVNTYVAPCHTGMTAVNLIRSNGVKMIAQDEWLPEANQLGAETYGWMGTDEIDMKRDPAQGCAELQAEENARETTPPAGAAFYNNFGKGVLFWESDAQAACYVNVPDIPSFDEYWFSDNNVCGSSEGGGKPGVITANNCHVAANYGWSVQRLRNVISPVKSKPVFAFVELGCPFGNAAWPCIQTAQIRAAAFHALIAGAMGVEYFAHSFKSGAGNGTCSSSPSIQRDCLAVKTTTTNVSNEIQGLAPMLYAPRLTSGFTANANVRAVAKWSGGRFWVIAATAGHIGPVAGTFSINCVGDATATVVGENRSVPVAAGRWSDTFANPTSVHVYRIDGGSVCGLS